MSKYLFILFVPTALLRIMRNIVDPLLIDTANSEVLSAAVQIGHLLLSLVGIFFIFWLTISIIRTCSDIYRGIELKNVHDELADTRGLIWPAILASIASSLVSLVWFIPIAFIVQFDFLQFMTFLGTGIGLFWTFAAMIPAAITGLYFIFAPYEVVIQKQHSVMKSLAASLTLLKNRWWKTLWLLGVPWVTFFFLAYIPKKTIAFTQLLLPLYLGNGTTEHVLAALLVSLIYILVGLFFTPLVVFAKVILYAELKKTARSK